MIAMTHQPLTEEDYQQPGFLRSDLEEMPKQMRLEEQPSKAEAAEPTCRMFVTYVDLIPAGNKPVDSEREYLAGLYNQPHVLVAGFLAHASEDDVEPRAGHPLYVELDSSRALELAFELARLKGGDTYPIEEIRLRQIRRIGIDPELAE